MALGARPRDVMSLVIGDGLWLIAAGLVLGIAGGGLVTRLLAAMLYGVSPTDPATFAFVLLTLVSVALAACAIPARRASRVDPLVALRLE
jgi:ABC-type antimicrobial peptide transport system permease subunit